MQFCQNKLLVFPTSRKVREYINSKKELNTLLPTILTIDEFFKKSIYFENRKYIDEDERFLYLNEATKNIDLNKLGISKNFTQFLKQSDYIYRFFLELSSEHIDLDDIKDNDTYEFYSEHVDLLKQIHINYLSILDEKFSVDRVNLSKFYKINKEYINHFSNIELYFEGYFTKIEFEIIKKISTITPIYIEFIYNQYNKKSIEKFIDMGFDLELDYKYKIDLNKKEIIEKNKNISKNIFKIKGFSSRINQIAFIKKSIEELVNSGLKPSNIAVVLPDEKFSASLALIDSENYFNFAMGKEIYNSKLFKISQAIYEYILDNELKNIENLFFLDIDKEKVDEIFKKNWTNILNKDLFMQINEFISSYETNKELLEKYDEIIYKLEKLFFYNEQQVLLKDFYRVLLQKISQLTLDDIDSGKITVMGLLESRMLNFDGVIICDFNESLIPKRSIKDKFLSTKIKNKVKLPTALDREKLQKYYYKRLISNSKYIYVSYVKNETEQISRFASKLFDCDIDEKVYDNEYKEILYSNKRLKHFDEDIILDLDLSKITWSASALKQFLECKRKYYLNHILKIKEHDISLMPKGYELGNIVHKTLESYYKQDIDSYEKLLEIFNQNRANNSFLNFDFEVWKSKLENFYKFEKNRFETKMEVLALEKSFLTQFENINIKGTIDRIDKLDDNYIVIDYKTSKNLVVSTKRTYEKAVDFQLEFYYLAVKNLYNTEKIETYYYDLYNTKLIKESVLEEKLEVLSQIFNQLHTTNVNFLKCENLQNCQYCIYKTICNR